MEHIPQLVIPIPVIGTRRIDRREPTPGPEMLIGDRELGGARPARRQVAEHGGPAHNRFAFATGYREDLFPPLRIGADRYQKRCLTVLEPGFSHTRRLRRETQA